jgi:hypothetical protein
MQGVLGPLVARTHATAVLGFEDVVFVPVDIALHAWIDARRRWVVFLLSLGRVSFDDALAGHRLGDSR